MAKDHLASHAAPPGDKFHDLLLRFLDHAVKEAEAGKSSIPVSAPPVEQVESDRRINPQRTKLDEPERKQLAELLAERAARVQAAEGDVNITHKMCTSKALFRGEFLSFPADDEDCLNAAARATRHRFENPSEMNTISLTAPDGTRRVVVLFPETSPEYFQALRHRRALHAEYEIALRSFFLRKPR